MLPAITFLLTAACVFFFALLVLGVLQRAFEKYKERYVTKSMNDLSDMFLFVDPGQILLLNIAAFIFLAGLGYWLGGLFWAAIFGIAGFFFPMGAVRFYRARRIDKFNAQLTDALQQMANALRAGLTFQQAMEQIGRESEPPLRQEFGLFIKEIKLGVAVEEGLINMAARVGSEDLELVATSTNIARQLGGNMAEMFETIAATIRERFRLEGKIRSVTSQGKLQGWIVSALPILLGIFLSEYRPDLWQPMFAEGHRIVGYGMLFTIFGLELLGFLVIRRIVNIDV